MGKRIDIEKYVGKTFENKIGEKFKVIKYLFKDKTNHCFDVEFVGTKNVQLGTLNQIRNGTCIDVVQKKKIKRLQTELDLRKRNRLVKQAKNVCHVPNNLKEKNVLAIDLSTTSTGIAYSQKGEIVRWKTIKAEDKDFRKRGAKIIEELVKILKKGKIDFVVLEDVYLGLNSSVLTMLSEVRGMLTYPLVKLNIDLLIVPPVLWKHRIEGVPVHREEQKEFMMKKFLEYTGENPDSDDVADAYMMLRACLED